MNEAKKSDVDLVMNALNDYLSYLKRMNTTKFDVHEFFSFMEPIFIKAVYREQRQGGGQSHNILLLTGDGRGDFVFMSPAIREIRRIYPKAHITLLATNFYEMLAENCPYVDEIVFRTWQGTMDTGVCFEKNLTILPQLLEKHFDMAITFKAFADFHWLMYASGARIRVTSSPIENFKYLCTHIIAAGKYGNHVVDYYLSVIDSFLKLPVVNRELEVWYTPKDLEIAKYIVKDLPRPLYALMMGAAHPRRHYPPEKYAQLIKMILLEEPTATFINFGAGPIDLKSSEIFRKSLGEEIFKRHIVKAVNKSNFRTDSAIISFCDMYIGNNTGFMVVASAAKCPCLLVECFPKDLDTGFYDIPRLYSPYKVPSVSVQPQHALPECAVNEPYHQYGCRADKAHCITQIAPETLLRGFHLLKEKISKKDCTTTYIY